MIREPTIIMEPEKTIIPVYDPRPRVRSAPAVGPLSRDLEVHRQLSDGDCTGSRRLNVFMAHPNAIKYVKIERKRLTGMI
jgi:hypothetical protein